MGNLERISDYATLRKKVHETLLLGQQKIEREKVYTYWQAGKHIHEHILHHKKRADYEKGVISKLSKDLRVSDVSLYEILKFARAFPIYRNCGKLPWSILRKIATIPNAKRRQELVRQAEAQNWKSNDIGTKIRKIRLLEFKPSSQPSLLKLSILGPFYTYKIIRPEAIHSKAKIPLLDLGFSNTLEMALFPHSHFPADSIVSSIKNKNGTYSLTGAHRPLSVDSLYTYKIYLEYVIDGDTLKVEFQLGFGNRHRDKIRLAHINCPEMDTPEGRAAKRFVEAELKDVPFLIIKSTKTEKWGRYLGDVFYAPNQKRNPEWYANALADHPSHGKLVYLNQLLLNKSYAIRFAERG